MARSLDQVLAAMPAKRRGKIVHRAAELATSKQTASLGRGFQIVIKSPKSRRRSGTARLQATAQKSTAA